MAMSDKQFVAMVFDPSLKFGDTIPKIEGHPWDDNIHDLRIHLARWYSELTIEHLLGQIELSQKIISAQKDLLAQWSNSSPKGVIMEVTYDALKKRIAELEAENAALVANQTPFDELAAAIMEIGSIVNKARAALAGGKDD